MGTEGTFVATSRRWRIWVALAGLDVREQYRHTRLGVLWVAVGVLFFSLVVGQLWSIIFARPASQVIPWLSVGMPTWLAISGTLNGGPQSLTQRTGLIRTLTLPIPGYSVWFTAKTVLTLLISLAVAAPISILFQGYVNLNILWLIPGIVVFILILLSLSLTLGILGARYRSLVEVARLATLPLFLLSPVVWQPSQVGTGVRAVLANLNPIASWIALVREPVMGSPPAPYMWLISLLSLAAFIVVYILLWKWLNRRLVYWIV